MHEEYSALLKIDTDPECTIYIGARMYNLFYELNVFGFTKHFSFKTEYERKRLTPTDIKRIIAQYKHDMKLCDTDMREHMKDQIKFFEWCVKNNLMIYPA